MPTRPATHNPMDFGDGPKPVTRQPSDPWYRSKHWQNLRKMKLGRSPLCEICYANDERKRATDVDHIIPIREGGSRYDMNNLQSLCHECHSRKTMSETRSSYGT